MLLEFERSKTEHASRWNFICTGETNIHSQSPGTPPHTLYEYGACILHCSVIVLLAPAKYGVYPLCPGPLQQRYFSLSVNSRGDKCLYSAHVQGIALLLAKLHEVSAHSTLQFIKVPLDYGFFICFVSHSIALY